MERWGKGMISTDERGGEEICGGRGGYLAQSPGIEMKKGRAFLNEGVDPTGVVDQEGLDLLLGQAFGAHHR